MVRSVPFLLFVVALDPRSPAGWWGPAFGTTAASVPLAFVSIALYARFAEQTLLDVPEQTVELARSLGASPLQLVVRFLYGEARSGLVLSLTTVTISLVSYSTIMGVVGGGGVGDFAIRYGYQTYQYELMYTTIGIMVARRDAHPGGRHPAGPLPRPPGALNAPAQNGSSPCTSPAPPSPDPSLAAPSASPPWAAPPPSPSPRAGSAARAAERAAARTRAAAP